MKNILTFCFSLMTCSVLGQAPAVQRQYYTTNTQPDPVWAVLYPKQSSITLSTGPFATTGENSRFVYLPGSGTVKALWMVPNYSFGWTNPASSYNPTVQVFTDLGANTNPPTAALKNIEMPIRELGMFNYRFASNGVYQSVVDSEWLFVSDTSTNNLANHAIRTLELRLPIQFTNGCMIRLTNLAVANLLATNGYFGVTYDSGAPIAFPHARLKNLRYNGTITGNTSNFLGRVSSGRGFIIGFIQGGVGTVGGGEWAILQDSHSVRIDFGSGAFWESTGNDDMFANTFASVVGTASTSANLGGRVGSVNVPIDTASGDGFPLGAEQFRWMTPEPLWFTNGFHASFRPLSGGDAASYSLNILYYTLE